MVSALDRRFTSKTGFRFQSRSVAFFGPTCPSVAVARVVTAVMRVPAVVGLSVSPVRAFLHRAGRPTATHSACCAQAVAAAGVLVATLVPLALRAKSAGAFERPGLRARPPGGAAEPTTTLPASGLGGRFLVGRRNFAIVLNPPPPPLPSLPSRTAAAAQQYVTVPSPSSPAFAGWADSAAAPVTRRVLVYVFNVTNADEVVRGLAAPRLQQLGPVRLTERRVRHNVSWPPLERGDVVQFKEWVFYTADEEAPVGSAAAAEGNICGQPDGGGVRAGVDDDATDDDFVSSGGGSGGGAGPCNGTFGPTAAAVTLDTVITTVNVPFVTAAVNGYAWLAAQTGDNGLFATRTIRQLLFGHQDDALLAALAQQFPPGTLSATYAGMLPNVSSVVENDAQHGWSRQYTGVETTYRAREYLTYDGQGQMYCCLMGPCGSAGPTGVAARPAWGTATANGVRGTAGDSFRAGVQAGDTLRVFQPGLSRSVEFTSDTTAQQPTHHGIPALRFTMPSTVLATADQVPSNAAYYSFGYAGVLNASNCRGGMPLFVSKPFFLDANASIPAAVGLPHGDPNVHDSYFDVEPHTGLVVGFHHRWQVSMFLSPYLQPTGGLLQPGPQSADALATGSSGGGGGGGEGGLLPPPPQPWLAALPNSQPLTAPLFPAIDSVYAPLFWVDHHGEVTEAGAADIDANVLAPLRIAVSVTVGCGVVAGVAAAAAIAVWLRGRRGRVSVRAEGWERGMTALMGDAIVAAATRRALLPPGAQQPTMPSEGVVSPGGGVTDGVELPVRPNAAAAGRGARIPAGFALGDGGSDYGSVASGSSGGTRGSGRSGGSGGQQREGGGGGGDAARVPLLLARRT